MLRSPRVLLGLLTPALLACPAPDPAADTGQIAESAPTCDAVGLRKLASRVESAAPGQVPAVAAKGVLELCGATVPGVVRDALKAGDSLAAVAVPAGDGEAVEFASRACPDAVAKSTRAMEQGVGKRAAALYAECGFEKLGWLDAETAAASPPALMVWALHRHLLDQGLEPDRAAIISGALLELAKGRGSGELPADLSLPVLAGDEVSGPPLVVISRSDARVAGASVDRMSEGVFGTRNMSDGDEVALLEAQVIVPLRNALLTHRQTNPNAGTRLRVAADADFPFLSLRDLQRSAAEAGYRELEFLVDAGDGRQGQLTLLPADVSDGSPVFSIEMRAEGLSIQKGGTGATGATQLQRGDLAAIAKAAIEQRAEDATAHRVRVSATLAVPLGRLFEGIAAARGESCGREGGRCVLPDVEVVPARAHDYEAKVPVVEAAELEPGAITGIGKRSRIVSLKSSVLGALKPETVAGVVGPHMGEVLACYDEALVRTPDLEGHLVFEWRILEDGSVGQDFVSVHLDDPSVGECVLARVREWRFPAPSDGRKVSVEYDLGLAPGVPPKPTSIPTSRRVVGPKPTMPPPDQWPPKPTDPLPGVKPGELPEGAIKMDGPPPEGAPRG